MAQRGPTGALPIGDAETVGEKIPYMKEVLGGISRLTFQMGVSTLPHPKRLRSIEILGTHVAAFVRKELTSPPVSDSAHSRVQGSPLGQFVFQCSTTSSSCHRLCQGTGSSAFWPGGRRWSNAVSNVASVECCAIKSTRSTRSVSPNIFNARA